MHLEIRISSAEDFTLDGLIDDATLRLAEQRQLQIDTNGVLAYPPSSQVVHKYTTSPFNIPFTVAASYTL